VLSAPEAAENWGNGSFGYDPLRMKGTGRKPGFLENTVKPDCFGRIFANG